MTDATTEEPEITWAETGLDKHECLLLQTCLWAIGQVPNGHYLTGRKKEGAAAKRLIERGLLTLAPDQIAPSMGDECMVVVLTGANWAAVHELARVNRAAKAE